MDEERKRGLTIFLEFWLLIGLLAGFNLYSYFRGGSRWFLVTGIVAVAIFVGWAALYVFYFRKPQQLAGERELKGQESRNKDNHGNDNED